MKIVMPSIHFSLDHMAKMTPNDCFIEISQHYVCKMLQQNNLFTHANRPQPSKKRTLFPAEAMLFFTLTDNNTGTLNML